MLTEMKFFLHFPGSKHHGEKLRRCVQYCHQGDIMLMRLVLLIVLRYTCGIVCCGVFLYYCVMLNVNFLSLFPWAEKLEEKRESPAKTTNTHKKIPVQQNAREQTCSSR